MFKIVAFAGRIWRATLPARDWLDAAWKSPWMGAALLATFWTLALYWLLYTPSTGKSVAALAVVATVMTFRGELNGLEKTLLTLALFVFVFIEIKAIDKDRADNEAKQRDFFQAQKKSFSGITLQASNNFTATTSGLMTAINGLDSVIGQNQEHFQQTMTKVEDAINTETGGDAFCYIDFTFQPQWENGKPLLKGFIWLDAIRVGKYPLHEVSATLMDHIKSASIMNAMRKRDLQNSPTLYLPIRGVTMGCVSAERPSPPEASES
jgi:hypothetical protein